MVNGVVTTSAGASVSTVPGDSNADIPMLLCPLSVVDKAVQRFASPCRAALHCRGFVADDRNQTYFGMLADDLQILVVYTDQERCENHIVQTSDFVIKELEGKCCLKVSTPKLAVVANRPRLLQEWLGNSKGSRMRAPNRPGPGSRFRLQQASGSEGPERPVQCH